MGTEANEQIDISALQSHMAELRNRLSGLHLEKEAVEEQLADILADRLLGKRISLETLSALETQQRENAVDIGTTSQTIDGLQQRLNRYTAEENARQRTLIHAEVIEASIALEAAQNALYDAIRLLSDTNEALVTATTRFEAASGAYRRYGGSMSDFQGITRPRGDMFHIPANYIGKRYGATDTLRDALERWISRPQREREALEADLKAQGEREVIKPNYADGYSDPPRALPSGSVAANELAAANLEW